MITCDMVIKNGKAQKIEGHGKMFRLSKANMGYKE
jgi:hypothetical protein